MKLFRIFRDFWDSLGSFGIDSMVLERLVNQLMIYIDILIKSSQFDVN